MPSWLELCGLTKWVLTKDGTYSSGRHLDKRFLAPEASGSRESTVAVKYRLVAKQEREGIALLKKPTCDGGREEMLEPLLLRRGRGEEKNRWRNDELRKGSRGWRADVRCVLAAKRGEGRGRAER